jgi:methylated-DNA-protein-cysteine methyltransferase-like protein
LIYEPVRQDTFFNRVYEIVAIVPAGHVVSYGQIARMLGSPGAARTVGWALSVCPEHLPWQRVVRSDGSIAGGGFSELRRTMLYEEGVSFLEDGRVDMENCRWTGIEDEAR